MGNYCVGRNSCVPGSVVTISNSNIEPPLKNQFLDNKEQNHHFNDYSLIKETSKEYLSTILGEETYESQLLNEINFVRTNPKKYATKLEKMQKYIIHEGEFTYFQYITKEKILLQNGESIFTSTIDFLNNLEPIQKLNWCDSLRIEFPPLIKVIKNIHLEQLMVQKRLFLRNKYNEIKFTIDFFIDPTLSVIFQITDELFKQERRKTLLNPSFSHFAVSHREDHKRKFISLLAFA